MNKQILLALGMIVLASGLTFLMPNFATAATQEVEASLTATSPESVTFENTGTETVDLSDYSFGDDVDSEAYSLAGVTLDSGEIYTFCQSGESCDSDSLSGSGTWNDDGDTFYIVKDGSTVTEQSYSDAGNESPIVLTFDLEAAVDGPVYNTVSEEYFDTIQEAIDAANDNDIIEVAEGTYNEVVLIDKPLSLLGPNEGVSAVTGARNAEAQLTERINISATEDVTVSGLEFFGVQSGNQWTIYISGDSDSFTFKNNRFIDIERDAIRSGDSSNTGNITVTGNLIDGVTDSLTTGIRLGGTYGTSLITDNKIDLNSIGYAGIQTPSADGLTISGNEISNTTNQGLQLAGAAGDVVIENNTIANTNTSEGGDKGAIRLYGNDFTGTVTISGNTLSGSFNGIAIKDGQDIAGKDIQIANNNISGNSNAGIYNGGIGTLSAAENWWGDASGPAGEGSGTGDIVSEGIIFEPWLCGPIEDEPEVSTNGCGPVLNEQDQLRYLTIQAAIDSPDTEAGETLTVSGGVYNENVVVNKGVTIEGANTGDSGSGSRVDESIVNGSFKVVASNVVIDGLKITGGNVQAGEYSGVYVVQNSNNVNIKNNLLENSNETLTGRGVINETGGVVGLEVSDNFITGWATGVYTQYAEADIVRNVIDGNNVGNSNDSPVDVTVTENNILNSDFEGIGIGQPGSFGVININQNNIVGNEAGVTNYSTEKINAEDNWWGDVAGTTGDDGDSIAKGTASAGGIDHKPWLCQPFENGTNTSVNEDDGHICVDDPRTTILVPDGTVNGAFTVNGVAYAGDGLNRVYVQLVNRDDNQRYGGITVHLIGEGQNAEWSVEYDADVDNLPDGTYAAHASVTDLDGSTGSTGWTENFIIDSSSETEDNANPVISNASLSDQGGLTLTADINGTGSNVADVQYRIHKSPFEKIDGFGWVAVDAVDGSYDSPLESISSSIDLTGLAEGDYLIRLRAFDEAGNKKSGVDVEFSITPPVSDGEESEVVFGGGGSLYQGDPDGEVLGVADINDTSGTEDLLAALALIIANIQEAYADGDIDGAEALSLLAQANELLIALMES